MLESLTCGPMLGGRDSEVIPGSLVVPGSILESDVMGPSTVDMSTHTHSLITGGGHFGSSGVP